MKFPRLLASPLAGTSGVMLGLCLLAIPLYRLTSARPAAVAGTISPVVSTGKIPTVVRLRLLAPATRVVVKTTTGTVLLDLPNPPGGESEHDTAVRLADGGLDLTIHAEFADSGSETAVFLTVMPDAYEERTGHAIGSGILDETLHFTWHEH